MGYYCLQCHGVIYDRTSGNCAVCGAELSEGSFLSPAGIERMRRESEETEAGHKRDSGRREAEEQTREDRAMGGKMNRC